jgi:hypothetical protein
MSQTAHAQRLKLRLFLEGVEIPVIAAQVQAAPNSPMVATIQVPPLAEGTRLLPRTLVHLFFLDMYEAASPFITIKNPIDETPGKDDPTAAEPRLADELASYADTPHDKDNTRYKVLFIGELVGFEWTKNESRRSLVLQCVDLSNYWDYAYQWSNTDIFGPGIKAVFSGGATNLFTDFLSSKGSVITGIVTSGRCNTFPNLKGLAAGIVRLIEAIGGTYTPAPGSGGKRYAGQNLFFSLAELRLHITQMVGAYENDPTAKRILSRQGYTGMFERALGGQGGQTSIRQAINALSKIMFHEMYGQPCPLYIPGGGGEISGVTRRRVKGDPTWGFISDRATEAVDGLSSIQVGLKELEVEADQLKSIGIDAKATIRSYEKRLQLIQKRLQQTSTEISRRTRGNVKPPEAAKSIYSTSVQLVGRAVTFLRWWRSKAPQSVRDKVYTNIDDAIANLKRAEILTFIETARKDIYPARLVQQIFRPDIWFGAPPRCNVLFPEHYHTLNYKRMFLQEPTRFLLKTNDEFFGEDFLFDRFYFAPQAGTTREDHARIKDMLRRDVLDHELFTGILPVFEKMGEFNIFAARSGTTSGDVPKVSLAQRSANFLYFKHRFNSRQMQVSGRFNPWLACGFPGLIIDKYVDASTLALHNKLRAKVNERDGTNLSQLEIAEILGTNFLGNFTQVVHNVSQAPGTGSTQVNCSYPRQPEESTEFLGAFDKIGAVRKRDNVDATRSTTIAAVNPPKPFSLGPNNGRITYVQDVTNLYVYGATDELGVGTEQSGKLLPLFDVDVTRALRKNVPARVPIGVPVSANSIAQPAVEQVTGGPDVEVIFRAYMVTESVPRYTREQVLLPAEELIRPGWYGDIWSPSKIGQVYTDFFSIGAITDAQVITGPGGQTSSTVNQEAEDALADQQDAEDADDPRNDAPGALALEEGASIQQACEFLHLTYSYIKQAELDIEEFIRAYTWRPVATMVDIFGTSDLEYTSDGLEVVGGREGFHSKAFGPYDDLYGLVPAEIEDVLGIKRGERAAQRADTRKRKLEAVQAYISALRFSRAILG